MTVPSYEFTLSFVLAAPDSDMDAVAERLYAHGCDDALVGIGHPGRVALDFAREAPSARDAVLTAINDVASALPGAALIEVSPDLVGISDIADHVARSRQNIRKLLLACDARVPVPVHEGSSTLWHLAPVLEWLRDAKGYRIDPAVLETARVAMSVNTGRCAVVACGRREDALEESLGIA